MILNFEKKQSLLFLRPLKSLILSTPEALYVIQETDCAFQLKKYLPLI